MKNFCVRKAVSIFELTTMEPVYKAQSLGNGKYEATKVGEKKVPLVERGMVGIEAFFTVRTATPKKQMWAIVRVRRARMGQLSLL